MSFDCLIPARYAATRLPGKPLLEIAGRPLVVHVCQRAAAAGAGAVHVATDDPRIEAAVREAGYRCLLTGAGHPSGTDRLAEAAALLGLADERIVVNVQGDEPQVPPALIRQVAELLAACPQARVATLCWPERGGAGLGDPNVVKVVTDAAGHALYFSRSPLPWRGEAEREAAWYRHIGLYAVRAGYLREFTQRAPAPAERLERLEQLRALHYGDRIRVAVAAERPPAGVDTPADLARVRAELEG